MALDNFKGGLEVAGKKSKPFSSVKKSVDSLINDRKSSLEFKKSNDKLDSVLAANKNNTKLNKFNVNNNHNKKGVSKNGTGSAVNGRESFLSKKVEAVPTSDAKGSLDSSNLKAESALLGKNGKELKSIKGANKKEYNGKVNNKGKSNLKAKNELLSNSTSLKEAENSNKETSKNKNKKSKSQANNVAQNVFDFESLPDVSALSPKSKEWVGNLFPVLECYDFTLPEILKLIKCNDYNPDKIENAVSLILQIQSGHEQGEWQTIGVKPPKPKEQDKGKAYNEKVTNYFKAQALENEKKKQENQNQLKKNLTKAKLAPQKNGIEVNDKAPTLPKDEQSQKSLEASNFKKGASSFDSSKPFSKLAENFIESAKASVKEKSMVKPDIGNSIGEMVIPKLVDMTLKNKASNEFKNARFGETDKNVRKLGKNFKNKSLSPEKAEKLIENERLEQHLKERQGPKQGDFQSQNVLGKSFSNYPQFPHFGFPEYSQQPVPNYQHYQDPGLLGSFPSYKGYQHPVPDVPKYSHNSQSAALPTNYSVGQSSTLPIGAKSSNLQKNPITESFDAAIDKLKGVSGQASKIRTSGLKESSLWNDHDSSIAQPTNWKPKTTIDQNTQTSGGSGRDISSVNSQSHVFTNNYSMPPGFSTSYPYSYSSYYNPNYSGMMYSTQNPQMHSQHLVSYNQYDSSYKYMNGPPGLTPKVNTEPEKKILESESLNNKFESRTERSFGKSQYEGIQNPPGLTNYYSQYNPYGNHNNSYNNMSNWG